MPKPCPINRLKKKSKYANRPRRQSHQVDPTAVLTEDLLLLTTSWLNSREATCFRATSQTSCRLVLRNIPASTADFAYCEAATRPSLAYLSWPVNLQERPHLNRFSPLRCWQFSWADIILALAPRRLCRDRGFVLAIVSQRGYMLNNAVASQRRRLSGRRARWLGAPVRRRELEERQRRRLGGRHARWLGARVRRRELKERQRHLNGAFWHVTNAGLRREPHILAASSMKV